MVSKKFRSPVAPTFRPGIELEPQRSPVRLIAIDGAKKRAARHSRALTTNGLHLVTAEVSAPEQRDRYAAPLCKESVPSSVVSFSSPLLLRTMWVASLICYAGVLVWFAN